MPMEHPLLASTPKEDHAWRIRQAADTLKEFALISKDPELVEKAQAYLEEESQAIDDASRLINGLSSKTPDFHVSAGQ